MELISKRYSYYSFSEDSSFELPDGSKIEIGDEKFEFPEIFFTENVRNNLKF